MWGGNWVLLVDLGFCVIVVDGDGIVGFLKD